MAGQRGRRTAEKRSADRAAGVDMHGHPLPRAGTHWPTPCTKPPRTEKDYFVSRRWRFIEGFARAAAGHRCRICDQYGPKLTVRLLDPDRIGRERPDDVIALCSRHSDEFSAMGAISFRNVFLRRR
jgi:hypothetical protein